MPSSSAAFDMFPLFRERALWIKSLSRVSRASLSPFLRTGHKGKPAQDLEKLFSVLRP